MVFVFILTTDGNKLIVKYDTIEQAIDHMENFPTLFTGFIYYFNKEQNDKSFERT